jgi:hypothetical protein
MKLATLTGILATGLAMLVLVFQVTADEPIFVEWLVVDDPGDETILNYWQRAQAGELGAEELVDLGTMLFYRGWPNDAVNFFQEALELDPELSEAWFRTGLVKHHSGDLSGARSAYKKCLKKQSGHAWANFYLGLLEEQTGEGRAAMEHYEMAFKHAPELADPKVNPEILSSKLQLGAQVRHFDSERFEKIMPMPFLDPAALRKARRQVEKTPSSSGSTVTADDRSEAADPDREAAAAPESRTQPPSQTQPSRSGAAAGGAAAVQTRRGGGTPTEPSEGLPDTQSTPYGVPEPADRGATGSRGRSAAPQIGETSPEVRLRPLWPGLYRIIDAFV